MSLSIKLTRTLGTCPEWWAGRPGAPIQWPCEQHADLVLSIRCQVADLVWRLVYRLQVVHGARDSTVLNFAADDRPVTVDGVGIKLDPQIGGSHCCQLRGSNGYWRFWVRKGAGKCLISFNILWDTCLWHGWDNNKNINVKLYSRLLMRMSTNNH